MYFVFEIYESRVCEMAGLISSLSFHVNGFFYYLSKTDIHPAEGSRIITQLDVCLSFVTKVCF